MNQNVRILAERISAEEYIDFLKRTDLGSQYPKERFDDRIAKLVTTVSISLVARNENCPRNCSWLLRETRHEEVCGCHAVQQNRVD